MGKLAAFKEFVPGRVMVVVLIFVSLAGAAYLVSANKRGDHLTARNFHSLNAIASNIGASLETLDAVVKFSVPALNPDTPIQKVAEDIGKKLADAGTTLSGAIRQIQIRDELPQPSSAKADSQEETSTEITTCKAGEVANSENRRFSITPERTTLDGPLIDKVYVVTDLSAEAPECRYIIISYDVLNSGNAREGFFDSTVIAEYREGQEFAQVISNSSNSGIQVSPDNIGQLFFSRREAVRLRTLQELEISAANERAAAFTLNEEGASFSNPKDAKRIPFSQSTVTSIRIGGQSFTAFIQPVVLDATHKLESDLVIVGLVKTGRFNQDKYQLSYNLLYLLLLLLLTAGLVVSLLHLALIGKRELLHRKNTLLANLSALGLQAMVVLAIMQLISVSDLNSLFQSSTKGIFESIRSEFSNELEDRYNLLVSKQKQLMDPLCGQAPVQEYASEEYGGVENIFLLDSKGKNIGTILSNRLKPPGPGFNVPDRNYFKLLVAGRGWVYKKGPSEESSPLQGRAYFMDRIESKADGEISTVLSTLSDPADPEVVVARSALLHPADPEMAVAKKKRAEMIFAGRPPRANGDCNPPAVLAYTTHFASLRNTVLPAGFGFAVFDNITGQVLFHSDSRRSLRENFYQATDDNSNLKTKVVLGLSDELTLDYKGDNIEAFVGPLKDGVPWSLVAYYRNSVPDVLSFHFGLTGGVLVIVGLTSMVIIAAALVAFLGVTLTTADQRETFRWRKVLQLPRWMCPLRERAREYRLLGNYLLAAIPIAAGLLYYTDEFLIFWYFAAPLTAILVWHRLIRRELYPVTGQANPDFDSVGWGNRIMGRIIPVWAAVLWLIALLYICLSGGIIYAVICLAWIAVLVAKFCVSVGQSSSGKKPRAGLTVYRKTVTLFGIIFAVFPTLMLLNHNYDVHEQLWVKYNQWHSVDRLKARYNHIARDVKLLNTASQAQQFGIEDWTGVYLPRTEMFSLTASPTSQPEEGPKTFVRHTRDELLTAGDRDEYYNAYLLADRNKDGKSVARSDDPLISLLSEESTDCSNSLPRMFASWLPNLDRTGDMIRSFDQDGQQMESVSNKDSPNARSENVFGCINLRSRLEAAVRYYLKYYYYTWSKQDSTDAKNQIVVTETTEVEDKKFNHRVPEIEKIGSSPGLGKMVYQETHDRAGITYRIINWYPHTRSPDKSSQLVLLSVLVVLVSIIWLLSYWLNGLLISRFFTDAFEDGLYSFPPDSDDSRSPFTEGAIVVTPPGTTLQCFREHCERLYGEGYLSDLTRVKLRSLDAMAHWTISRSANLRTTIACFETNELSDDTLDPKMLDFLDRTYTDGDSLIIIAGLDLSYALSEAYTRKAVDLRNPYPVSPENCLTWRAFLSDLPTFYFIGQEEQGRRQLERNLYRAWETSSNDEQMVLAALIYEDRTNPLNTETLTSLYRRSLICTSNYGFTLSHPEMKRIIKARCSYQEFCQLRATYENETWLAWKKPIIVVLTLLLVFVLFVAKDQLSVAFSLIATVLTGIGTVGLISERVRGFKGALFDQPG